MRVVVKGRDRKVGTLICFVEITTPSYPIVEDLDSQIFYDPIRGRGYFKETNKGEEERHRGGIYKVGGDSKLPKTHCSTSAKVVDNDANQLSANRTRWRRTSEANCNSPIPQPPAKRIVQAVVAMWSRVYHARAIRIIPS